MGEDNGLNIWNQSAGYVGIESKNCCVSSKKRRAASRRAGHRGLQKERMAGSYIMRITTKFLHCIALTGFVVGFTTNVLWGIGLPVGAVFFGLFLIFKLLEKESALFDEEQHLRLELAARHSSDNPSPRTVSTSSHQEVMAARARASA